MGESLSSTYGSNKDTHLGLLATIIASIFIPVFLWFLASPKIGSLSIVIFSVLIGTTNSVKTFEKAAIYGWLSGISISFGVLIVADVVYNFNIFGYFINNSELLISITVLMPFASSVSNKLSTVTFTGYEILNDIVSIVYPFDVKRFTITVTSLIVLLSFIGVILTSSALTPLSGQETVRDVGISITENNVEDGSVTVYMYKGGSYMDVRVTQVETGETVSLEKAGDRYTFKNMEQGDSLKIEYMVDDEVIKLTLYSV